MILNLFSTTPPSSNCPLFQAPWIKKAVKTSVFIGEFNEQTFHLVGCVRARAPCKFIDGARPPVNNHSTRELQKQVIK